jgi:hypothetical protein
MADLITVADYIERLKQFPPGWRVVVSTQAGGGISVEPREINGEPIVAVFGSNGGRFGESPLTEDEYKTRAAEFLRRSTDPYFAYTSVHGDHRHYHPSGINDTCYGTHYDRRIVERMVAEGLIAAESVDLERVRNLNG